MPFSCLSLQWFSITLRIRLKLTRLLARYDLVPASLPPPSNLLLIPLDYTEWGKCMFTVDGMKNNIAINKSE